MRARVLFLSIACAASVACGGARGATTKTTTERLPNGGTRTVTVTTRLVEAPSPPARPADPYPADPRVRHNVDQLNAYRRRSGLAPLLYDQTLSAFALEGSRQYARDHTPHAHFAAHVKGAPGFGPRAAENQGDPHGVPPMDEDPVSSGKKQIDVMLKMMFDEGPGGGHYDNMMNPRYRRVGIGLSTTPGGALYLTNDLSD